QRAVERAAGSVLGDETNELRFAQRELEDLTRELERDRREGDGNATRSDETASDDAVSAGLGEDNEEAEQRRGGGTEGADEQRAATPGSNAERVARGEPAQTGEAPGQTPEEAQKGSATGESESVAE